MELGYIMAVIAAVIVIIAILVFRPARAGASTGGGSSTPLPPPSRLKESIPFREIFISAGSKHGVNPCLLAAVAKVESSFNPRAVNSADPSYGIMQFLLPTARDFKPDVTIEELFEPAIAIPLGAKFIRWLESQAVVMPDGIDAYNVGIGNFRKGRRNLRYRDRVLASIKEVC